MSTPTTIEVDEYLPYRVGQVWRALTDPALLAEWLMPNNFAPIIGHRFQLQARPIPQTGFSGVIDCEVLELRPERLLRISWDDAAGGLVSTVTWRLEPEGRGVRLFLTHEGFDPDSPTQQLAHRIMDGGWRSHVLNQLKKSLSATFRTARRAMSDAASRFRLASDGFRDRVAAVRDDQWDNPTPCPQWTVRDIVGHVINEQRRVLALLRGQEPETLHGIGVADMGSLPAISTDADPVAAWTDIADGLVAAIDDPSCREVTMPTPMGPAPFADGLDIFPEDVLIHTWDIARAIGADENLDPIVVAHVFEHFQPLDEVLRQPWAFGPKVTPPAGADLQTQFLCFVGRAPQNHDGRRPADPDNNR